MGHLILKQNINEAEGTMAVSSNEASNDWHIIIPIWVNPSVATVFHCEMCNFIFELVQATTAHWHGDLHW